MLNLSFNARKAGVVATFALALFCVAGTAQVHAQAATTPLTLTAGGTSYQSTAGTCDSYSDGHTECLKTDGSITTCQNLGQGPICDTKLPQGGHVTTGTGLDTGTTTTNAAGKVTSDTTAMGDAATGSGCSITALDKCLINVVATVVLGLANLLLGWAGVLFNWVVVKTVFQFATVIGNQQGLLDAWGIIRDLGNIAILFVFIFIGIATILQLQNFAVKKALPGLIIFAVLINFSLFAAEAVIDTSNVFSTILYSQANTDPCGNNDTACTVNNGIAGHIMKSTGLAGIYDITNPQTGAAAKLPEDGQLLVIVLCLAIFAMVGSVVMIAGAIMLAIRCIVLTGLMIMAPLGFAGPAIPGMRNLGKWWWKTLVSQAFFAPVFLLLIFISLKIGDGLTTAGSGNGGLSGALLAHDTSEMGIFLVFTLVIGALIASLIAAKRMGAFGANMAVEAGAKYAFGAQNLVMQGGARTSRMALQRSPLGNTAAGRFITNNALRPIENGALDARRVPGVSNALSMAGAKAAAKPTDSLKKVDAQVQNTFVKRPADARKAYDAEMGAIKAKNSNANLVSAAHSGTLSADEKRQLAKQSVKGLEKMKDIKAGNKALVDNLSTEQYEGLMKSDALSDGEKGAIRTARYQNLNDAIASGPADVSRELNRMSKSDLESLPPDILAKPEIVSRLSEKQRDDLTSSNKRTAEEKKIIRDASPQAVFENAFDGAATPAAKTAIVADPSTGLRSLTAPQVAKLKKDVLKDPAVAIGLTPAILMEIQESKKLSGGDISEIASHIKANPASPAFAFITTGPGAAYWS